MEVNAARVGTGFVPVADINYVQLGRRMASQRILLDMTQKQLGIKAHVSQRTIAMLERGRRSGLRVNTLMDIASALQVTMEYLLRGESEGRREGD
jgi:transcriptional regulator with XRE-family HTH domain